MSSIYETFFDFNQVCPDKIKNCMQLRLEYKQEVDKAIASGCTKCNEGKIKVKYMERIWNDYMSSI